MPLGKVLQDDPTFIDQDLLPGADGLDIGSAQKPWRNIYATGITPVGPLIPSADNVDDLGTLLLRFRHLYLGSQLYLANGTTGAINARNAANNAFDPLLWLDATDNAVLNAITGKTIKFSVNAVSIVNLSATELAGTTDAVVALGDLTHRFTNLFLSSNLNLATGTGGAIQARNAANSGFNALLWSDASDNTVINAITGKLINISINSVAIANWSATELAPAVDNVIALGDLTHRFTSLNLSSTLNLATGTGGQIQARNAANSGYNPLLWSDASDNAVLNAITGKVIKFSVNGAAIFNMSAGKLQQLADFSIRNSADSSSNFIIRDAGDIEVPVGNLKLTAAGKALSMQTGGAAATSGTFVCNGASNVTINTTSIGVKSIVIISLNTVGGTVGQIPHVTTITAGTSFTVAGTASDTSTYNWAIVQTV